MVTKSDVVLMHSNSGGVMRFNSKPGMMGAQILMEGQEIDFGGLQAIESYAKEVGLDERDVDVLKQFDTLAEDARKPIGDRDYSVKEAVLALKKQAEEILKRTKEESENTVNMQRKGREIERFDIIMPRRITQAYSEVEGKFFSKDSNRLIFEDKGEKLATSTTNKEAIADMVMYAKAKQWESLKLSGSQEFRREAWLEAESQGIKTQGYTPKTNDLAELQKRTQERSTNLIQPLKSREASQAQAPRHDINKNQAALHAEATKGIANNIQVLQKNDAYKDRTVEDLTKLAYWRGVVQEQNKGADKPTQDEALARFDKQAQDPEFLRRIQRETEGSVTDKTTDRTQKREGHELSL